MAKPSQDLKTASSSLQITPLERGDAFYVDLTASRASKTLTEMKIKLREVAARDDSACHMAFVGHRGSGKSTELLRLEEEVCDVYYPIHLYLDDTLRKDGDYPDLFLWLVSSIAQLLQADDVSIPAEKIQEVADWFASVTEVETDSSSKSIGIEAEAKVSAKASLLGSGIELLSRIKSAWSGSHEFRSEKRKELKRVSNELIQKVNNFLFAAAQALEKDGKCPRLLIVQDNLDRLDRQAALNLFEESGEILKQLDATFVWTAPVGTLIAPFNINTIFDYTFSMPMISVKWRDGKENPQALEDLRNLVAKRLDIDAIFESHAILEDLIFAGGGCVRDMLKIIENARLRARASDHLVIEEDDAEGAKKEFAIDLKNALFPANIYFPILGEIALDKGFDGDLEHDYTPERVESRREFIHGLIRAGAVLTYNGDDTWFDVHPTLYSLDSFAHAAEAVRQERAPARKAASKETRKAAPKKKRAKPRR